MIVVVHAVRKLLGRAGAAEHGQVLLLFAAGLAAFLGLIGLSVDVGHLVYTRTDLQKVADAAAFAASQDLPNSSTARATAQQYVVANGGNDTSATVSFEDSNQVVRVRAERDVDFWFFRLFGVERARPAASAAVRVQVTTGYEFDGEDVFPYAVWGGNPNPPAGCPYGICVGDLKTYRANDYRTQVKPSHKNNPNWDVDSNKFKGYFHHGTGIVEINTNLWQTFSEGGNAMGQEPLDALHDHYVNKRPILLPVVSGARTVGSDGIEFKIVAWVALELTADPSTLPSSADWQGRVVAHYATSKGSTTGSTPPPTQYATRTIMLIE